jgi:hypothetical protein
MPDPNPLADQIQALTVQLTNLKAVTNRIDADLTRRFGQLNDMIGIQQTNLDKSNTTFGQALSGLEGRSVTHKVSLPPITPALDGGWIGGTTSAPVAVVNISGGMVPAVVAGGMPVDLPHLSRIAVFRASFEFGTPPAPLVSQLIIALGRLKKNEKNGQTVAQLLSLVPGSTGSEADPIPGTELVDTERFTYSIGVTFITQGNIAPGSPVLLPQGLVVLKSFQVDCIEG